MYTPRVRRWWPSGDRVGWIACGARWKRPTGVLLAAFAVSVWAAAPEDEPAPAEASPTGVPGASSAEAGIDVETILNNPLDPSEYQEATRCISSRNYRRIDVLDEFNLLFVGRRKTWLNRLRTRCPGLEQDMIIYISQRSSRVCTHDHFRGAERGGFGIPTPTCVLGDFESIDAGQEEGLRDAIVSEREAARGGSAVPPGDGG